MPHYAVTDRQWALVALVLSGKVTDGGVITLNNRLFFNALVWLLRTGAAWADLPERFSKPDSVCRRFRRLAQKDVWQAIFDTVKAPELDWVMLDSTVLRAHQYSGGQKKRPRDRVSGPQPGRDEHQNSRLY